MSGSLVSVVIPESLTTFSHSFRLVDESTPEGPTVCDPSSSLGPDLLFSVTNKSSTTHGL